MKKYLLLLLLFLGASMAAFAHPEGGRPDTKKLNEIREYKIKYLAQEMELTDAQKPKFVETYNQRGDERVANYEKMCAAEKKLKEKLSDAEFKSQMDIINDCKVKDAQIVKNFDAKFEKFLSAKQIYKMKEAEEKFRKRMKQMYQERKQKRKDKKK